MGTRLPAAVVLLAVVLVTPPVGAQRFSNPAPPPREIDLYNQFADLRPPTFVVNRQNDPDYPEAYRRSVQGYHAARAEIARNYLEHYPYGRAAVHLLTERWKSLIELDDEAIVEREAQNVLAMRKDEPARVEALYQVARIRVRRAASISTEAMSAIEQFIRAAPRDERGAQMLYDLGWKEPPKRAEVLRHIIRLYPRSRLGKLSAGQIRQAEGIGKPFELNFVDAVSRKPVSLQRDLKGKVVVIDFWATWCGPCIAEMPNLKRVYDKYRNQGVEFIGVSLDYPEDRGGLRALLEFLIKEQIPWPQYYQGKDFDADFSAGWGVSGIPTTFLIDREGKLAVTDARASSLDLLIPLLLQGKKIEPGPDVLKLPP